MSLIGFLDLTGILFLIYALWAVFQPQVRKVKMFLPFWLLIILFLVNSVLNFLESLGYEARVEPFEEYIQVLIPAAFFVVFSFIKFEEREEVLHSRNRVLTAIHTVTEKLQMGRDTGELWSDLLRRVINIMGFDGGFIHYPGDKKLINIGMKWEGWELFSDQLELLDIEDTILSEVLITGKPVVVEQAENVPDSFIRALNISGVVSVTLFPVSCEAKILGVMGIISISRYKFSDEELDLFTMLGHHFGEIIHNSLLVDGAHDQADDLKRALEGRKHFLTLISNDLKEPLMRIRTVIQRLMDEMDPARDSSLEKMLNEANYDSEMLERLIDDVRELAKLDSGSYEFTTVPLDLVKELGRIKEQFQIKAESKGVSLTFRYKDNLSPVEADLDLIYSAMRHILSNALKYTPAGGQVIIDVWEESDIACIKVIDTGIGIDEADSDKIFDMFYRSSLARDKERIGTGLGLTIVNRIIKLHRGEIIYSPGPEGGSVFTIRLPRMHLEE